MRIGDEAEFERSADRRLVDAGSDEDKLLAAIAPESVPVALEHTLPFRTAGPTVLRHGGPPSAERRRTSDGAGQREFADPIGPGGQPEVALGADQARPGLVDEGVEGSRMKVAPGPIDEPLDAVLLRLGNVIFEAVEFLEPSGCRSALPTRNISS